MELVNLDLPLPATDRGRAQVSDRLKRYVPPIGPTEFVSFEGGVVRRVMAFGIHGGLVHAIFVITNPDKLRHLNLPT